MRGLERWVFAQAGFVLGVMATVGVLYVKDWVWSERQIGQPVSSSEFRLFPGRAPADMTQHLALARDLAQGRLTDFPNGNETPEIGFGDWDALLAPGEGLILARTTHRDIRGAKDASMKARLVLYLPAAPGPGGQEYRFEEGRNAEGALLFVTRQSIAWGSREIGYPMRGVVQVAPGKAGGYFVRIGAEYRYAEFIGNGGASGEAAGWRDAGACLNPWQTDYLDVAGAGGAG